MGIRTNVITSYHANHITNLVKQEVERYFAKQLKKFTVPIKTGGTNFQNEVWQALQQIPYGTTVSYTGLATSIGKDRAQRAIGNANSCNNMLLIIPCHRVIQVSGKLGGYTAGIERKRLLLEHEKN